MTSNPCRARNKPLRPLVLGLLSAFGRLNVDDDVAAVCASRDARAKLRLLRDELVRRETHLYPVLPIEALGARERLREKLALVVARLDRLRSDLGVLERMVASARGGGMDDVYGELAAFVLASFDLFESEECRPHDGFWNAVDPAALERAQLAIARDQGWNLTRDSIRSALPHLNPSERVVLLEQTMRAYGQFDLSLAISISKIALDGEAFANLALELVARESQRG